MAAVNKEEDAQAAHELLRRRAGGVRGWIFRLGENRWLLPLPGFILLALVTLPPFLYAVYLSLTNQNFNQNATQPAVQFVGLQNYITVLTESRSLDALRETLIISLESTVVSMVLGFGIALLIKNYAKRAPSWVLLLFLLSMTIAPVVAALDFSLLLNTLYGPIDQVIYTITGVTVAWTDTPLLATETIVLVQVWQWAPLAILLLYSGLNSLPEEPREAALLDGVNRFTMLWYITLPLMRPVIIVSVIFEFILASLQFGPTDVLTNGGPGNATEAVALYVYNIGIHETGKISQAAAAGVLMLFITTILATIWVRTTSFNEGTVA